MTDHKIAILFIADTYDRYGDYEKVIDRVSDWAIVSEEDLNLLQSYKYEKGFEILEMPLSQETWISNSVEQFLAEAQAKKKAEEERREKNRIVREANRLKNEADALEKKRAQLAKLKQELGEV